MKLNVLKPFWGLSLLILIVGLACNAGNATVAPTAEAVKVEQPTQAAEKPTAEPTATVQAAAQTSGPVNSLEDAKQAVIQIEAEGTFVDPQEGWNINVGKRGTGFIIDPSGLAVTNNHVVTGAALLRVWVGGDQTKTYNAKVVGVSECSDLAVIDIEGDGFPYLDWQSGDIKVGNDVFAAGFPLGDPEYTLTNGIVSKEKASGETDWASVDYVIEHSARINPGNSGGPLLSQDGKVVGINYAGIAEYDQNFAISRNEALPVIDQLRKGNNVDSIGVNGMAVSGTVGDTPIYGIWVRSVESGSPADKARIQAGDIIYQLEGEVLATDGTMKDYCDILRSRDASAPMSVSVIRWNDLSLMEGQLNGRELETTGYFSDTGSTGSSDTGSDTSGTSTDSGYYQVTDDTGTISMEVPSDWQEVDGSNWTYNDTPIGVAITSAPSIQDWNNSYTVPGAFFGASNEFAKYGGYIQFLDFYTGPDGFNYRGNCTYSSGQRYDYDDGVYRGKFDYFYNCGGQGGFDAYVLSAVSKESQSDYIIIIAAQVPPGDGQNVDTIVQHIWDTFLVGRF
jgi:serine protease Do